MKSRVKRIKKLQKEISRLGKKTRKLEKKELSMDDLDEEADNVLVKIAGYNKKLIKRVKELRKLQNKHVYIGFDDINIDNLTDNELLKNKIKKEILSKYREKNVLPNFEEFYKITSEFEMHEIDAKRIFEKLIGLFKASRLEDLNASFKTYLEDKEPDFEETEELKKKLDEQNHFHDELLELETRFKEKAEKWTEEDELLEDTDAESCGVKDEEFSEDSETDSQDEEDGEMEESML